MKLYSRQRQRQEWIHMWADEDHSSRSFTRSRNESSFSRTSSTRSFKPTSLFALAADMDVWDNACLFESQQSSAQSGMGAISGLGLRTCSTLGFGHTLPSAMRVPWMPMSHLAPEDVPSFFSDPPRLGGELHSALGEWGSRRAGGLAHRLLQEAQQRLVGDQGDILKSRSPPPRHSTTTTTQPLDMKHKDKDNLQQQAHVERPRQPGKPQYNRETSTPELHEQEKPCPDTALLREALTSVKEVNETLRSELRTVKQSLEMSQVQLCELRAERDVHTQQMSTLEAQRTQLAQEKEEILRDHSARGLEEELGQRKEECTKLRETLDALEAEHQRLQDRCLCLESEVLAQEEALGVKAQESQKLESERLRGTEELRAMASFWNGKWQEAARSLSSTQRQLEAVKRQVPGHELQEQATKLATEVHRLQTEQDKHKEEMRALFLHKANLEAELTRTKSATNTLLGVELEACKQQLELEKHRSKELVHTRTVGESVQIQDKATMTVLSMPPKICPPVTPLWPELPSNSSSSPDDSSQWATVKELADQQGEPHPSQEEVLLPSSVAASLAQQLANMQKELREKEHALELQEILRDVEKSEAQSKISALRLKLVKLNGLVTKNSKDGGQTESLATDSPEDQSANRPRQQGKEQTAQGHLDTDDRTSSGTQNTKSVGAVNHDRQRRMVTEQLKNLFKEREQELGKACDGPPGAQTHTYPLQELASKSQAIKSQRQQVLLKCRSELYGSALAPVSEEGEEEAEDEEEDEEEVEETQGEQE